jgi:DNA-binding IclR family transcriptional regulator
VTEIPDTPTLRRPRMVGAVLRAIDLLEALRASGQEMGVSELARQTGMSKAAVYSTLSTLETRRLVARNPETSMYRLGWALWELGASVPRNQNLAEAARGRMGALAHSTGETALLSVLDGDRVTYLARSESPRTLRMVATPGQRSPLHATASGKVLLAYQPPSFVEALLESELERFNEWTVTDPDALRKQLAQVRKRGWGAVDREFEPELASIAVPVHGPGGEVVAALALAGPSVRITREWIEASLPVLVEVAAAITKDLDDPAHQGMAVA